MSASEKVKIIITETKHPDQDNIVSYMGIIQIMIYLVLSIKIIIGYSKDIKNYFSFTEKINLNWLLNLVVALVIIWLLWFLDTRYPTNYLKYMEAGMFTFFIYFLGFKGVKQPEIFKKATRPDNNILETESIIPSKKYEKTRIFTQTIDTAIIRLTQLMETEKVYKNSQLTLPDLAVLTELPNHHLSQILNENLKLNFYDYVNKYRVEEVKCNLLNPQKNNFTILALALDAGFNSKASFNKAFKKHTGISPSEFKSQHQNPSAVLGK
ncbi:MAG: helix-turn-helix domain-containing protein [Pelobium sp.]